MEAKGSSQKRLYLPKGVEYLQKAGDHAEAGEELRHYKKTLFGKWVRR